MNATAMPRVMGIVNCTPDSFFAPSRRPRAFDAIAHALQLIAEGADIIDIGGESTRPGAEPVTAAIELERVLPVIAAIRERHPDMPISIDTTKAEVARQAIAAGATLVNDISAGLADPEMMPCVASAGVDYLLMHMHGTPRTMQQQPQYEDVVADVARFLRDRLAVAQHVGIAAKRCWIDPGIGFGKTPDHNLALLRQVDRFVAMGCPVVLGISRKSIIGHLLDGAPPEARLEGSLALAAYAATQRVAVLRVHDVAATRRFLQVWRHFLPQ